MKALVFSLLATALVLCAAEPNAAGKWSGPYSITLPDGTNDDGAGLAILKQDGGQVTGTIGPDEDNQWKVEKGAIAGNKVTGEATNPSDGNVFKFTLVLAGDRLKGPFTVVTPDGQTWAGKLDLTRAK
jgi:hypothetical protein